MSYSINTLFGDNPEVVEVPVVKDPQFVMGNPLAKVWSTVVQREKDGVSLQRDETNGMGLIEAIEHANNMRQVYRLDGFIEDEGRFEDPNKRGEYTYIFVK